MGIYLIVAGIIMFGCISVVLVVTLDKWHTVTVFGLAIAMLLFARGMESLTIESRTGQPKTSIKAGSYAVVGYAEVSQDEQSYYQLILEQDGDVKLYALPKDMIDTVYQLPETSGKSGTLEVIEKSGLRKATLYIPLRK